MFPDSSVLYRVETGELTQMVVPGNEDMPTMQSEDWQIGEQGVYRVR